VTSKFGYKLTVLYILFEFPCRLPFASMNICPLILTHTWQDCTSHMIKVGKENSYNSKEHIYQVQNSEF